MSTKIELDAIDREILFHLRQDGRLTNVELAKRVGLTPPPCLRRVKRLEDLGVIRGYHAVIDVDLLGRGMEVLVEIEIAANDLKSFAAFEEQLSAFNEVVELHRLFGRPDYYMRVAVADHSAYELFITTKLGKLPGVVRFTSHLSMKRIKAEY